MFVSISRPVFDSLFGNSTEGVRSGIYGSEFEGRYPAVDIVDGESSYELAVELPGVKKEDLNISVEDGTLMLSGERKHYGFPEGTKVLRHESRTVPFRRSFELPTEVDVKNISAELRDGILRITLPKVEQARPRSIEIK